MRICLKTSKGDINLTLHAEQTPLTCANFINLAQRGYYDDLGFHRVLDNFMIQGGCPQGTGSGGPGYQFEDECVAELTHSTPGVLSMANAGPGTNGSQFFITHVPTDWLDGKHTVFGKVVDQADQDIVDAIRKGDSITSIVIPEDAGELLAGAADQIAEWDKILDAKFPKK